jgi:hypothetical protein
MLPLCSNNLDVLGFLTAVNRMAQFWIDWKNMDCWKCGAVSLPGLSHNVMFSRSVVDDQTIFINWPESHSDLHYLVRENVVGGPSIVFNRIIETGKTRIRGGPKAKAVIGMDCAAMYLR